MNLTTQMIIPPRVQQCTIGNITADYYLEKYHNITICLGNACLRTRISGLGNCSSDLCHTEPSGVMSPIESDRFVCI